MEYVLSIVSKLQELNRAMGVLIRNLQRSILTMERNFERETEIKSQRIRDLEQEKEAGLKRIRELVESDNKHKAIISIYESGKELALIQAQRKECGL